MNLMNLTAAGRIVGRKATTVARQLVHERSTIGMTSTGIRVPTYRQYASVDDSSTYDRIKVLTAIGEVRWEDIVANMLNEQLDKELRNSMAYTLAMATLEGNKFPPLTRELNNREKEQLRISKEQSQYMKSPNYSPSFQHKSGENQPLPRTLQDALRPSSRAIVVTETSKPFRVLNVNKAWEDLCGYSFLEAKGKSLGSMLKGEETDQLAVTAVVNQLLQGNEVTTVLTNYTKEGRKFRNRLHVGPLFEDAADLQTGTPSYFVGVLKEVRM
eukprot:CAMPEP_0178890150 /NCGR_PEP_ID=MMETSP0747-20121128/18176_1 /TAXON_ID=913974 /ORGANISM="Nitzschia punctata, Strain CCMP561" /LENGTH=270 /DNA_ID=CAMNT_0020559757 /DNA_START=140 /DNA_END=953 /DNA_ORIENTATION=-